jgi:hypothetical protein
MKRALAAAFVAGAGAALFVLVLVAIYQEEQAAKIPPWPNGPGRGW